MDLPNSSSAEGFSTSSDANQPPTTLVFPKRAFGKKRGVQILPCRMVPIVAMAALRRGRIESYLRSVIRQERLNHFMTLNLHNDSIDFVDLVEVANQLVAKWQ